jgi:hypothetical protein
MNACLFCSVVGGALPQLDLQVVRRKNRALRRLQSRDHRRLVHGRLGTTREKWQDMNFFFIYCAELRCFTFCQAFTVSFCFEKSTKFKEI